jgi:biopolymer transport protein TolQ
MMLVLAAPAPAPGFFELILRANPINLAVLALLLLTSIFSWGIVFQKWGRLAGARDRNLQFLRTFRKSNGIEPMAAVREQFADAPMSVMFGFGYEELQRQVRDRGALINRESLQRALQIGANEEVARLETNLNWLATVAAISPFVGLFGTVIGIIGAFQGLGAEGTNSLRAVAPGIAEALVATAAGLFAAIPAAVYYNYFGWQLRDLGARMDDFSLEFMNAAERKFGG